MHERPTLSPPTDLTIPKPGSRTARVVLGLALRHLLAYLRELRDELELSDEAQGAYRQLREVLAEIGPIHPGAAPSLLRRPTIGAPLRCLRGRHLPSEPLMVELVSQCFFELAVHQCLPRPITINVVAPVLIGLSRGLFIRVPEGAREVTFEDGHISFDGDRHALKSGGVVQALPRVGAHAFLGIVDNNPLSLMEAHPAKQGNEIDLGGRTVEEWVDALNEAFGIILSAFPELEEEMEVYVQLLVPVGFDTERHLSASYQEAIGTLYLSLHPDPMTMAEALVHEFSHGKLNALFEVDPVLENAFSPLFTSPVRPDPRPLHGVLLAAHAFFPVARLYERMIELQHPLTQSPRFGARFAQIHKLNHEATETLRTHAKPTRVGAGVLAELDRWDAYFGNVRA